MNGVKGQGGGAGDVQPVEFTLDPQAGFIGIDHLSLAELVGNGLIDRLNLPGNAGGRVANRVFG
jgi:hypothetical protein